MAAGVTVSDARATVRAALIGRTRRTRHPAIDRILGFRGAEIRASAAFARLTSAAVRLLYRRLPGLHIASALAAGVEAGLDCSAEPDLCGSPGGASARVIMAFLSELTFGLVAAPESLDEFRMRRFRERFMELLRYADMAAGTDAFIEGRPGFVMPSL